MLPYAFLTTLLLYFYSISKGKYLSCLPKLVPKSEFPSKPLRVSFFHTILVHIEFNSHLNDDVVHQVKLLYSKRVKWQKALKQA